MPLLELQAALALSVRRGPPAGGAGAWPAGLSAGERDYLERVVDSRGLAFAREVRHSWCAMRATRAARLTLGLLSAEARRRALDEWLELGGGASSFFESEALAFLAFLDPRLPAPSHVLSVCRFEQALFRASSAAPSFVPPRPAPRLGAVRQGAAASLVTFLAAPASVLSAAEVGAAPPPPAAQASHLLFAPGIPSLCFVPGAADLALWQSCATGARPRDLEASGHEAARVRALLEVGALQAL